MKTIKIMKSSQLKISKTMLTLLLTVLSLSMSAQFEDNNAKLITDSKDALETMIEKTPKLETFSGNSYAYVVFPKVTKAGIAFGGAFGKGIVFKNHQIMGSSKLKQASIGLQFGGQQYKEVIFFEDQKSFELFSEGKLKFNAQVSAVALAEGVAFDAAYRKGVAVFTMTNGGLMYEAAIGGQHFKYQPKIN